jgi:anti-anti-sigma factor
MSCIIVPTLSIDEQISGLALGGITSADGLAIELRPAGPDGRCVLAVRGEADLASADVFERCILEAERLAPRVIVLDLEALGFMDSSGISVLIKAQQRADRADWELLLENVPESVQRLLEIVGLESHFAVA